MKLFLMRFKTEYQRYVLINEQCAAGCYNITLRNSMSTSRWFLALLTILPERWKRYVSPKRQLIFTGCLNVIFQKMELFIVTYVKTSNQKFKFNFYVKRQNLSPSQYS
jgi:hypothetical protein